VGAVGDRLLVQSSDYQDSPQPDTLGLWRPGTHQVWVLGRAASANYAVIGAVTLPGSAAGLVAWIPASCGLFRWTCIKITNIADMSSLTVRSPTRHGFALGGAFTPNGRALAAFPVTGTGGRHSGPAAGLTVINTRTGAVRVVARARYPIGAATLWAAPVPGKDQFLAGGPSKAYAVDPGHANHPPAARQAQPRPQLLHRRIHTTPVKRISVRTVSNHRSAQHTHC